MGKLEQVLDGDLGAAQFDGDLDGNIQNHVELVHHAGIADVAAEGGEDISRLCGQRGRCIADSLFGHRCSPVVLADLAVVFRGRVLDVFHFVSHFFLLLPARQAVFRARRQ
eukprot:TRINITY_DN585_c0_g1_i2.p5 TRINITY_DN585_c0_g1~~TRINITY_DN585_c0_g1_i2.p5  ORF type:complete len:111 (-),score=2.67 TRINITY_DN585_c0_g1_i2:210-542(-)